MNGPVEVCGMKGDNKDNMIGGLDKWEVRNALDTLNRAHTIKENKKMMAAVGLLAQQEMAAMAHIVAHTDTKKP